MLISLKQPNKGDYQRRGRTVMFTGGWVGWDGVPHQNEENDDNDHHNGIDNDNDNGNRQFKHEMWPQTQTLISGESSQLNTWTADLRCTQTLGLAVNVAT